MDFELVKKICVDYVMEGFNTLKQLPRANDDKPFRFIYASGAKAERDQTKRPWILGDYTLMRVGIIFPKYLPFCANQSSQGRIETQLLDGAKESGGIMETCCLRLGLVKSPERMGLVTGMLADAAASMISLPLIDIREISAAAISAAVHGFEKDTLDNDDLIALGRKELKEMGEEPSS